MVLRVGEAADLESVGGAQEGAELRLRNVHLPHVHELQQRAHVRHRAVAHEDYRVRAWVVLRTGRKRFHTSHVEKYRAFVFVVAPLKALIIIW